MPKFMLLIGAGENTGKSLRTIPPEELMEKYGAWTASLAESGKMESAHKLFDGEGRKVSWKDGRIFDGPFVETRETIGGYYVIEAASYDEAVGIARGCPTVIYEGGFVEVRKVEI